MSDVATLFKTGYLKKIVSLHLLFVDGDDFAHDFFKGDFGKRSQTKIFFNWLICEARILRPRVVFHCRNAMFFFG